MLEKMKFFKTIREYPFSPPTDRIHLKSTQMVKKKSKQEKAPRLPFRERFEQMCKRIAKGNKWAKKVEKNSRVGLYLVDSEKAFIAKTMGVMQCFWSQKLQAIR